MEINKEQLKGYLEIIILNTLRVGPSYGYEIIKKIRKVSKEQFQIKEGTLYVILKRLEREDLVESFWEKEGETGGGRRRYYRIKEKGEIYLKTKKEEWEFFKKIIDLFYKE
ncbi:MAG: PadR family transcriptional regulator [Clostridiales bacterium]|nr:PadR family transcriptional regulator [Clostridiales bacterium]